MLSVLIVKGIQYIDCLIVAYKFDESTFAQFRYGAKEFPLILLPVTALSEAISSRIANNESTKDALESIKRENKHIMHICITSKYLYPLVFNEDFYESALVFNIFCFTAMFRFILPESILIGRRESRPILAAATINLVVNVALGFILVNFIGIVGVAIAFLVGNIMEKIVLVSVVKSLYGIRPKEYLDTRIFVSYAALMAVCMVVSLI